MRLERRGVVYLLLLVVRVGLIFTLGNTYKGFGSGPAEKSYADMIRAAQNNEAAPSTASGSSNEIDWSDKAGHQYKTVVNTDLTKLDTSLQQQLNITYKSQSGSSLFLSILPNIIFLVLIGAFMWYMLRQTQSGNNQAMSFGRSGARMLAGEKPMVTFSDVAGVEEAKQELSEVVEFLKFPDKFTALGARIPKGVLLIGPPGTGKTLISKAVAGEAGVPFFSISGSEFVEMFVGVGASRVRDLFDQAKKNSPCIVFVDEIDAVGRQRGPGLAGAHGGPAHPQADSAGQARGGDHPGDGGPRGQVPGDRRKGEEHRRPPRERARPGGEVAAQCRPGAQGLGDLPRTGAGLDRLPARGGSLPRVQERARGSDRHGPWWPRSRRGHVR